MTLPALDVKHYPLGWEPLDDYVKGEDEVWRNDKLLMSRQDYLLQHHERWYIARRAPEES